MHIYILLKMKGIWKLVYTNSVAITSLSTKDELYAWNKLLFPIYKPVALFVLYG